MKVERISDRRLIIILNNADMEDFKIDRTKVSVEKILSQDTVQTAIMNFLDESELDSVKMVVEVLTQKVGCTIIVSLISSTTDHEKRRRYKIKNITEPIIFKFCSVENLIRAVSSIKIYRDKVLKCHLVELKGKYFFVVFPKGMLLDKIRFSLCEYGTIVGKGIFSCAFLKERGNLILENNAHFILNKYFDSCC